MSGHSKWSTIKHKKAREDSKRGKIFTRLIREITVAARIGGGDPDGNPRLRSAITAGRAANMPLDNIERAIQKGTGELEGMSYEEVLYEGYGPGGIAILVEAVTDNKVRTVADVRYIFNKYGGSLAEPNAVAWQFEQSGQVLIEAEGLDEDAVMMAALEAGAEDVVAEDEVFVIQTAMNTLFDVEKALREEGMEVREAELTYIAKNPLDVPADKSGSVERLMEALDDCDDVQNLHTNAQFLDQDDA